MEHTIANFISRVENSPDHVLLDAPDGVLSYEKLYQRALNIASVLEENGHQRGDRVAIVAKDYASGLSALFGAWLSGAGAAFIHPGLPTERKKQQIQSLGVRVVLVQGAEELDLESVRVLNYIELPARGRAKDPLRSLTREETALWVPIRDEDGAFSWCPVSLAKISRSAGEAIRAIGLSESDRLFVNLPIYHMEGLSFLLGMCSAGGTVIARNRSYLSKHMVEKLQANRATSFVGGPTQLKKLLSKAPQQKLPEFLTKWITTVDVPSATILKKAYRCYPKIEFCHIHALEADGGFSTFLSARDVYAKAGSVGKSLPGVQIEVRKKGKTLEKSKEVGEVWVNEHGHSHSRFEKSSEQASLDLDGFLWLKGRTDSAFRSGNEWVHSEEIEQVMMGSGMCFDVAVIPESDSQLGKIACAYVVPNRHFQREALYAALAAVLPESRYPKKVLLVDDIPRMSSGKISVSELRREAPQDTLTV